MSAAAASIDPSEVEVLDEALRDATAEEVVEWAASRFAQGLVMSSSFGSHSAVMLHLVSHIAPQTPVIFIDTGYLFPETYRFAEALRARFKLSLHVATPTMSAARREALFGEEWEQGDEGVTEYLRVHKVEPMQRALDDLDAVAWMAGLRGGQSAHRASLPRVGVQNGRIKVHPILPWGDDEVTRYMSEHALPLHPLVAKGYRSVGDIHSTLPTSEDMDPRDGRILGKKKECGLHLPLSEDVSRSLKSSGL